MLDSVSAPARITCLGGGHGLYQTLCAARACQPSHISAVVTVADDGGSSGRLRRELSQIPPGDLRMALAALASHDEHGQLWSEVLQHRFGGNGALAGHAVGNLLIAGLYEVLGDELAALDAVAALTRSAGRVFPVCTEPLDIEADVSGLDEDPRIMRTVRGQVAVASTVGQVRRVRVIPEQPNACAEALAAINDADMVTLGPGSWFSSVIPHLLIPSVVSAVSESEALKVVILNLTPEAGETSGFSAERHIHMLAQHAPQLKVDRILIDSDVVTSQSERNHLARAALTLGAEVSYQRVREEDDRGRFTDRHDPTHLAAALKNLWEQR
ncbi:uridine diphosphate-N-acetylglucosamine-binding protein YvcK [Corynebacterium poyangense]|uniref:Putative gluconeogenesis factor n=1 Tax=Corynebacterium poyangense TaxID=2684405 RepID=A0A7H0SP05_9CORY|nr:uridine diphosphate-N-acetylglucosamine-binding protein YvcK [Corynebacterium poyangense]MBZ8177841.1 uridine diphosphate-N-acetylglucosamine-binding protein YvcK [Corynebacterium poyangense]QNQ90280.1 uridine diphosphate-N-acetylglucosamine-binding protein YvcK [Corynebacterium poyangense]